jgi:uncharacterized membrane protein
MISSLISNETTARRAIGGLWILSGVALGVLAGIDQPLFGVIAYAFAIVAVFVVSRGYDSPLFDERDEAIRRDAAAITLKLFGLTSAGVFPTLTAAWGLGYFDWEPWSVAIAFFVAALYATFAILQFAIRRKR